MERHREHWHLIEMLIKQKEEGSGSKKEKDEKTVVSESELVMKRESKLKKKEADKMAIKQLEKKQVLCQLKWKLESDHNETERATEMVSVAVFLG